MGTPAASLHYIHDPLCGWCYGASPLVTAARAVLPVTAHGGGMMAGRNRRQVTADLRNYVMPHDHRIAQLSGQVFGERYFNGLLTDTTAVFDSGPPIAAVLAMQSLKGNDAGLDLLAAIQRAHYQDGRRISDESVLVALAEQLGADGQAFAAAMQQQPLEAHFQATRDLLDQVGGRGFPTFVLQRGEAMEVIEVGPWLGRPVEWAVYLREAIEDAGS
ncbi:DsbA family protein [Herbaspirillum sp. alder98]|uniref:DsbA family protein n=1 Tax=Herbaspirillum sp. alder98 TaxID=2913096 RepID=UPI001CD82DF7|nr:DsbA family protein [Herbaspirillum sp. alder98]MCA1326509.1 DsbA family protein [Herbaspirillum sp. alder98]